MMRPFLFLGVLALLTTWLMWPDQKAVTETHMVSVTAFSDPSLEEIPGLANSATPLERELLHPVIPEAAPTPEPTPPALDVETGVVYGTIRDHNDQQVTEGIVWVYERKKRVAVAPLEGNQRQFSVELPAGKQYGFMVNPDSLAHEMVPPLAKSRVTGLMAQRLPKNHPDFYLKSVVEVKPGDQRRMDLAVSIPAKASGRIFNPKGEPVSKATVRLTKHGTLSGQLNEEDRSNFHGDFVIPEVFPGEYMVSIFTDPEFAPAKAGWNPPSMKNITIHPGQDYDFGDIYLGLGRKTVVGWIVNQDGDPFSGLPVLCKSNEVDAEGAESRYGMHLTRVVTDIEGRFELKHLDSIPVSISITPDFYPGQAMGQGKPAMWENLVKLDLSDSPPLVDVGELVVHESRPFEISGGLVFDPAWLAKAGNNKRDLKITIGQVEGEQLPEGIRRNPIKELRVPIDWMASTYGYKVETPMTAVRITFSMPGYSELRFVVRPEALQSKSRTIQIPADFESLGNR
jgi:hypothetical protein